MFKPESTEPRKVQYQKSCKYKTFSVCFGDNLIQFSKERLNSQANFDLNPPYKISDLLYQQGIIKQRLSKVLPFHQSHTKNYLLANSMKVNLDTKHERERYKQQRELKESKRPNLDVNEVINEAKSQMKAKINNIYHLQDSVRKQVRQLRAKKFQIEQIYQNTNTQQTQLQQSLSAKKLALQRFKIKNTYIAFGLNPDPFEDFDNPPQIEANQQQYKQGYSSNERDDTDLNQQYKTESPLKKRPASSALSRPFTASTTNSPSNNNFFLTNCPVVSNKSKQISESQIKMISSPSFKDIHSNQKSGGIIHGNQNSFRSLTSNLFGHAKAQFSQTQSQNQGQISLPSSPTSRRQVKKKPSEHHYLGIISNSNNNSNRSMKQLNTLTQQATTTADSDAVSVQVGTLNGPSSTCFEVPFNIKDFSTSPSHLIDPILSDRTKIHQETKSPCEDYVEGQSLNKNPDNNSHSPSKRPENHYQPEMKQVYYIDNNEMQSVKEFMYRVHKYDQFRRFEQKRLERERKREQIVEVQKMLLYRSEKAAREIARASVRRFVMKHQLHITEEEMESWVSKVAIRSVETNQRLTFRETNKQIISFQLRGSDEEKDFFAIQKEIDKALNKISRPVQFMKQFSIYQKHKAQQFQLEKTKEQAQTSVSIALLNRLPSQYLVDVPPPAFFQQLPQTVSKLESQKLLSQQTLQNQQKTSNKGTNHFNFNNKSRLSKTVTSNMSLNLDSSKQIKSRASLEGKKDKNNSSQNLYALARRVTPVLEEDELPKAKEEASNELAYEDYFIN